MKLSVCVSWDNIMFDAIPFRGDFKVHTKSCADIGFDGVELAIRDPLEVNNEYVLRTLHESNLQLSAIGTGQAWSEDGLSFTHPDKLVRRKAVQRVISHCELAEESGAVIIIGLLRGMVQNTVSVAQSNTWMYECFSDCCEHACKRNVRIACELINRYETTLINTVKEGLQLIHTVGSDNLGLLLDTFHMNIEEPSIEESIKMAGDAIFHFHYADSNRMYPGAGHIDFTSVIHALKTVHYNGYISGEHRDVPNPVTAVQNGYAYMKQLLQDNRRIL